MFVKNPEIVNDQDSKSTHFICNRHKEMFASGRFKKIACPFGSQCAFSMCQCPFGHVQQSAESNLVLKPQVADASTWTGPLPTGVKRPSKEPVTQDQKRLSSADFIGLQVQQVKMTKTDAPAIRVDQSPVIQSSIDAKVSRDQRQKVIDKFFVEFQRIYRHVLVRQPLIAHEHTLRYGVPFAICTIP